MALAIYRKYRPKTLSDLMGQELVVEVLGNAARTDMISHAYLFHGPRGTGKTTAARILAKIANCETRAKDPAFRKQGEPCNKCRSCLEIDAGRALDVVELDAASNTGVDDIRELKEGIRLSPTSYKYKVFIVDEAHRLSKNAFDALLKTLEEPPAHVIFILATTEAEKIPATISSRTQRFHFRRLPIQLVLEKLQKIAKEEKFKVDTDTLELIATVSEGSFRDAESLLEQVISMGSSTSLEAVERILGKVGFVRTNTLTGYLLQGDLPASLEYLMEINEAGFNLVQLTKDLIHYLRRILAYKFDPKVEEYFKREMTNDELNEVKKQAANIKDADKAIELTKSLIKAYSQMRYSPFAVVPLEIAIIENLK
ncbi:MAG: DNA polymerase III subunit gamma/tau [bacterium]|nr:DNA polymerase III subunit gamma/tau [bacterium]MDZ4231548.1 DNA polymerase III subunit gamma/tau [Patescibacteria group bacterium]